MFAPQGGTTKRRAEDEAEAAGSSAEDAFRKRRRFDEVSACSSAAPDAHSQAPPGVFYRSPEGQASPPAVGLQPAVSSTLPAPGWNRQPSLPVCSDISEQTMEDVLSNPQATPQTSWAEQNSLQLPAGPQSLLQRCNSAPDLRVLFGHPINPIPDVAFRPPESSSLAGALVPFKAPEEVVEDAVRHMLRAGLRDAARLGGAADGPDAATQDDKMSIDEAAGDGTMDAL